jgi:hypothetical protein
MLHKGSRKDAPEAQPIIKPYTLLSESRYTWRGGLSVGGVQHAPQAVVVVLPVPLLQRLL